MFLFFYFDPVLKGEPYVVSAVDHHEIQQAVPEHRVEFLHQPILFLYVSKEDFNPCLPGLLIAYLRAYRIQPDFGLVKPGGQAIIAFLVFILIQGDMRVLIDALLHELGNY